jgi:hypothetical protein
MLRRMMLKREPLALGIAAMLATPLALAGTIEYPVD